MPHELQPGVDTPGGLMNYSLEFGDNIVAGIEGFYRRLAGTEGREA